MFGVTILGNNSALPAYNRHPTAQVVTLNDHLFLVDCGEGTQMQMSLYKIRRSRINYIFISHLHGDHYFGLPGLITSYGLLNRTTDLHLYGPAALENILELQLNLSNTILPYKLHFHALGEEMILADEENFTIECFKTYHRIECWGFIFREKRKPRKINPEAVSMYKVPVSFFESLQQGEDIILNGKIIHNEILTLPGKPVKSYAFSADTLYNDTLAEKMKAVNLMYHETTYLKDKEEMAASRFHSTSVQAASIAKAAGAHKLIIGHFSSKYEKLNEFLTEASSVFPNTELAIEGHTFIVS